MIVKRELKDLCMCVRERGDSGVRISLSDLSLPLYHSTIFIPSSGISLDLFKIGNMEVAL